MDIHSNLEFLCRVCAANTKGKNSVAECVYILKTAGLRDKLDKFLYLKISENDSLPKVLCKSCFRQVEATASLSKIAKHTQQVFRDFLLSNLPKGPSESSNTSEFTSSDFMGKQYAKEKSKKDETVVPAPQNSLAFLPPPAAPILAATQAPAILQNLTTVSRKDEVVVNVSVADPLTRDNQQKMISNSQRRQSLLLESRYTPKSIAQKPATAVQKAPKPNQSIETTNTTNSATTATPALNFYPIKAHQQQVQQPNTQITTFSSGGYVIGSINTDSTDKEQPKKINNMPLAPTADNVLQQKRKNLVKALNNIKANNSGQVSLLKSSQQKQTPNTQNIPKIPLAEVVNQAAEDELPDKIIIAAPKKKSSSSDKSKKEPLNLSSKIPAVVTPLPQIPVPTTTATITAVVQQQQQQQDPATTFTNTAPKPTFPEDILLGRVIRDMDLLKLILKALKWPVNKQNMELQLQRLKNSKFTDIMSDNNLLQDTDLTQLLGPYLAPVLLAAQALQQQQQQILKNTTLNENMSAAYIPPAKVSALEAAQAEINKSIPYKLPPETSVQLVPATPEDTEPTQSPPLSTLTNCNSSTSVALKRDEQNETTTVAVPQKRQRRAAAQRARDSIVISDEEDTFTEGKPPKKARQRTTKSTANIQIDLNNDFMTQFNLLNGSGGVEANEALMALLQRQKTAIMKNKKVQRRRRNSVSNLITLPTSEFDALIDLDNDIVLMEPVTTTSSYDTTSTTNNFEALQPKTDVTNTFVIPSVPLITRPIIKRRKTVIHSSRSKLDLSTELKNTPISSSSISPSKERLLEETINQVATGIMSNSDNPIQQSPTKPIISENSLLLPTDLSPSKAPQQKKLQSKATLGQQLLEAIGLQKISTNAANNPQTEAASSSSLTNAITVMPNSKQSIQQIRSALKKSLKQAQEQQQQRKKELSSSMANNTIIQDADSTTKTAGVKEIVVVEGKGNKSDNGSSMVDVEDQIDKVTLMVRSNDKDNCMQPTQAATITEKQEKKEVKKSPTTKIQERRRTVPATAARGARNIAALDTKDKSNEQQEEHNEVVEIPEVAEDNEKPEKDDLENANISSQSDPNSLTTKETNAGIKEEILTPKRRGRKRLVDKVQELETAESNDKEKDSKTSPTISEKSRTLDKSKDEETDNNNANNSKTEEETASHTTSGRPTRQSKTLSKYYKGPDKPAQGRRSLPSRSTRNRKYS
ncbi:uncharacterized protein dbr [Calliphora vicina]|uniref:uncharacterized protein dbr n=1 Tax=Calliphora vicina TaxID=7373 RepID=UPI00325BF095